MHEKTSMRNFTYQNPVAASLGFYGERPSEERVAEVAAMTANTDFSQKEYRGLIRAMYA